MEREIPELDLAPPEDEQQPLGPACATPARAWPAAGLPVWDYLTDPETVLITESVVIRRKVER